MSNKENIANKDKSLQNLTIRQDKFEAVKRLMSRDNPLITLEDLEGINWEEKEQLIYLASHDIERSLVSQTSYEKAIMKYDLVLEEKSRNKN